MGLHGQNAIESSTLQQPAPGKAAQAAPSRLAGRIGLNLEADNPWAEPGSPGGARQFSAAFELEGLADQGQMRLFSPIGSQLAQLSWSPQGALLEASGAAPRRFGSLDALLQELTGAHIPTQALFQWLRGEPADVDGWTVDLSRYTAPAGPQAGASGRISAQRNLPKPTATLRVVLE